MSLWDSLQSKEILYLKVQISYSTFSICIFTVTRFLGGLFYTIVHQWKIQSYVQAVKH